MILVKPEDGQYTPDDPIVQPQVYNTDVCRSFQFSEETINSDFVEYKKYLNPKLLFSQSRTVYTSDLNTQPFSGQVFKLNKGVLDKYSTVIPLSANNLYFFRLAAAQTGGNYNTFLCLHNTSYGIETDKYQIDNTIPAITSNVQTQAPENIYHTFKSQDIRDKYYYGVYGGSLNYRIFPINQLYNNNFINYCAYDILTRDLNILTFSENTNYYAKKTIPNEKQEGIEYNYYLSFIDSIADDITKYSPSKNKSTKSLAGKYAIDIQMYKSYLVNATINKFFNRYQPTNLYKSYSNMYPINNPPVMHINQINTSYYNSLYFSPSCQSSAIITANIKDAKQRSKALYTFGHYNTTLKCYNIPLTYIQDNSIDKLLVNYVTTDNTKIEASQIQIFNPQQTTTNQTAFYLYFKNNLSTNIFEDDIVNSNTRSYFMGTINNNYFSTNYKIYSLPQVDTSTVITSFTYRNYLFLPDILSISGTLNIYLQDTTTLLASMELINDTADDATEIKYNKICTTLKDAFSKIPDAKKIQTCYLRIILSGASNYERTYYYTNFYSAKNKLFSVPFIELYDKYSETSSYLPIFGYCDVTINNINKKYTKQLIQLVNSYNNLYKYIAYRINNTYFNVLRYLNTVPGLMSYSQLLYCDSFLLGYSNLKNKNKQLDTYISGGIMLLNKQLTSQNALTILSACFMQGNCLQYTTSGIYNYGGRCNFQFLCRRYIKIKILIFNKGEKMINLKQLKDIVFKQFNTNQMHMPYVYYKNNNINFLFDIKINNTWKIFKYVDNNIIKINTFSKDFNNGTNQCNPFIIFNNNTYLFQYTYNLVNENLFISYGYKSDLDINLSDQLYKIEENNVYYKDYNTQIKLTYCDTCFAINNKNYKLAYHYTITCIRPIFNTNKLLFTLAPRNQNQIQKVCTLIYDKDTEQFKYIHLLNNISKSVYKCSIDPITKDLYYTKHIGLNFEDRTIQAVTKDQYEITLTNIILPL